MTELRIIAQRNPAWAARLLGNSPVSTIGDYGCLLCCYAMLGNVDPLTMQAALLKANGFEKGTAMMATPFIPPILDNWRAYFKGISKWYADAVPQADLQMLYDRINAGELAILLVDPTPNNPGLQRGEMHFVLAVGIGPRGIMIHDPWFGDVSPLCPRYGPDAATAIYQWRFYTIDQGVAQ